MTKYSNLKTFLSTVVLIGAAFLFKTANSETLDTIIAIVDDDVIMASELERRKVRARQEAGQRGTPLPPPADLEKQILERLIMNSIQLQSAKRAGIKVDDSMLNRAISNMANQNRMSLDDFRNAIESEGFSFNQFREDIREEITLTRIRQRQVDNRVFVSEREVKNFLATQTQQGNNAEEYDIQHILISVPEDADEDQKEEIEAKAEGVLQQLNSGSDFSEIATEISDSGNATEGGNLGWMEADKVPSLFSAQLATMSKGDLSSLIKNDSGFHIFKLVDKRSSDIQMIPQTLARHILIRTNELTTDEDAQVRLESLKERIEGGADFAELARSNSDDNASAVEGGSLGWVSPGTTVPLFEKEMDTLSDGEISAPFKSQFGWHIIQVQEHRQYDGTEELTVARARAAVKKRKVEEERQSWLIRLRDEAYVEYRL
ncbi:MAG: peptidylprolyl isomerase [Gammaproteobacteria bacterium]